MTAHDVTAGTLVNTAKASGLARTDLDDPGPGSVPVRSPEATATVTTLHPSQFVDHPSLLLAESVAPQVLPGPGQVAYTFTVTNNGNDALSNVVINDPLIGVAAFKCADPLAIGATAKCTTSPINITFGNDVKFVDNATATAIFGGPTDTVTSNSTNAPVYLARMSMVKTVTPNEVEKVGDVVTYTFVITNTGGAPLDHVSVIDNKSTGFTGTNQLSPITCTATTLAVGASTTCTGTYVVSQDDLVAGDVENTATASAQYGPDQTITDKASSGDLKIIPSYGLALSETVDKQAVVVGGPLTFTYRIANDGDQTMYSLNLVETAFTGNGVKPDMTAMTCARNSVTGPAFIMNDATAAGTLAPGQVVFCMLPPYTTVAQDVVQGIVSSSGQLSAAFILNDNDPTAITRVVTASARVISLEPGPHVNPVPTEPPAEGPGANTGGSVATNSAPMALGIALIGALAGAMVLMRKRWYTV